MKKTSRPEKTEPELKKMTSQKRPQKDFQEETKKRQLNPKKTVKIPGTRTRTRTRTGKSKGLALN